MPENTPYILGIDLGTNSLGIAALSPDESKILLTAVRRFASAGKSTKTGSYENGRESTKAAERTRQKSQRTTIRRHKRRLQKLLKLLQEHHLLPPGTKSEVFAQVSDRQLARKRFEAGRPFTSDELKRGIPYVLRARALEEELAPFELGRALYHLAVRRGAKRRRLDDESYVALEESAAGGSAEESDEQETGGKKTRKKPGGKASVPDSELIQQRNENTEKVTATGSTLGAYLREIPATEPVRGRPESPQGKFWRDLYEAEFEQICAKQQDFHPCLRIEGVKSDIAKAIFCQLLPEPPASGRCRLEDAERALLADDLVQRAMVWERVNNLRVRVRQGGEGYERLNDDQRQRAVEFLSTRSKPSYFALRRELFDKPQSYQFNVEAANERPIVGNRTGAALTERIGDDWQALSEAQRSTLVSILMDTKREDEEAEAALAAEFGWHPDRCRAVVRAKLPKGRARFSLAAYRRMLPLLEAGKNTTEAQYEIPEYRTRMRLAPEDVLRPVKEVFPELTNTVQIRALTQLRKGINEAIRHFGGKPSLIRIELARELKLSKQLREKRATQMEANRKKNEKRDAGMKSCGLNPESRKDKLRYQLWQESKDLLYEPGRPTIDCIRLRDLEIDHIIPLSVDPTGDHFDNLALCTSEFNRAKGSMIPREYFERFAPHAWDETMARFKKTKNKEKLRRLMIEPAEVSVLREKFARHQLGDTAAMSKLATEYVARLYGGREDETGTQRVFSSAGQITALLRNHWDFNILLSKEPRKPKDAHVSASADEPLSKGAEKPENVLPREQSAEKRPNLVEKQRSNARHHALDAVVVALATPSRIQAMAQYWESVEREGKEKAKKLPKPAGLSDETIRDQINGPATVVSYFQPRRVGGELHQAWLYQRPAHPSGKPGEFQTAVRRVPLSKLKPSDFSELPADADSRLSLGVVDPAIRTMLRQAVETGQGTADRKPIRLSDYERDPLVLTTKKGRTLKLRQVRVRESVRVRRIGKGRKERYAETGNNYCMIVSRVDSKKGSRHVGTLVTRLDAARLASQGKGIVSGHSFPGEFCFTLGTGDTVAWNSSLWRVTSVWMESAGRISVERIDEVSDKPAIKKMLSVFCAEGGHKVRISVLGEIREARD